MISKELEFTGHLIDSMIFTKVLDTILELEGEFEILEFDVGKKKEDYSYAKLLVINECWMVCCYIKPFRQNLIRWSFF